MSFLQKLALFCKSYSEPIAQLVECQNRDERVAGSRLTGRFFSLVISTVSTQGDREASRHDKLIAV